VVVMAGLLNLCMCCFIPECVDLSRGAGGSVSP
jgi:hypothetical protein